MFMTMCLLGLLGLLGLVAASCGSGDSDDVSQAETAAEVAANDNTPLVSPETAEDSSIADDVSDNDAADVDADGEAHDLRDRVTTTTLAPSTTSSVAEADVGADAHNSGGAANGAAGNDTAPGDGARNDSSAGRSSGESGADQSSAAGEAARAELASQGGEPGALPTDPIAPAEIGAEVPPGTPSDEAAASTISTRTGADRLVESGFAQLAGKRVGLIANHTSIVDGRHLIDHLAEAPNVDLASVFAPEHGVRGNADAGETFDDEIDEATGTPVQSLYGDVRQPTPEMLAGIDVIVYDLQDVGSRTYTYISTMGLAMQSAAAAGIEFVVLDRPNPLGNVLTDGFMLDIEQQSFIGQFQIPLAYGLTPGELAIAVKDQGLLPGLDPLQLDVITLTDWDPSMQWPDTGLEWLAPSPGLPTFESALAYPGTVLFEATSISYGTGGDFPFSSVGAPWVDGEALADRMNALGLPGAEFVAVTYTPESIENVSPNPRLEGEALQGIRIDITDRRSYRPVATAVHLLDALYDQARAAGVNEFIDRPATMDLLAGTDRLRTQLDADVDPETIIASWAGELAAFEESIESSRLYR